MYDSSVRANRAVVDSEDVVGKLATSLVGLTAIFSKEELGWSLVCCHWMLLLVLFPKLVSDWSKVHWMPSFRRRRVWVFLY